MLLQIMSIREQTDTRKQQEWIVRFLIVYAVVNIVILVLFFFLLLSVQVVLTKFLLAQWVPGIDTPSVPFYLQPFLPQP